MDHHQVLLSPQQQSIFDNCIKDPAVLVQLINYVSALETKNEKLEQEVRYLNQMGTELQQQSGVLSTFSMY